MSSSGGDRWPDVFSRYIHPNRSGLFNRVDFGGLVGNFFRAFVLGVAAGAVGAVIGAGQAVGQIANALESGIRAIAREIGLSPQIVIGTSIDAAARDLLGLGVISLPVAMLVVVATFVVMAFLFNVFFVSTD